jgi:signal transduction histidine kinase
MGLWLPLLPLAFGATVAAWAQPDKQPSVWDRYWAYILAGTVVVLAQTVLLARLLLQRPMRRRAEGQVRGREEALRSSDQRIRDLGGRLLRAQDTERSRIARELHDDISQQVALLSIDLEQLSDRVPPDAKRSPSRR